MDYAKWHRLPLFKVAFPFALCRHSCAYGFNQHIIVSFFDSDPFLAPCIGDTQALQGFPAGLFPEHGRFSGIQPLLI